MPAYSTLYSKFVDSDATTMTFGESVHFCWLRKPTAFSLVLPPLLFFYNYRSEAQQIGMPTFMLVKGAYSFQTNAAIFSIYLNYRGEAQHGGINFKRPLCHSISTTGVLQY